MSSSAESEQDKTQILISKLVKLVKTTDEKYPSGTDYRYFNSYPSFNQQSDDLSKNVLNLLNKLCQFVHPNRNAIDLSSESNEYLRWQTISDSADHCIEQVDVCLDQIKEQHNNQSLGNNNNHNISPSHKAQNRLFAV